MGDRCEGYPEGTQLKFRMLTCLHVVSRILITSNNIFHPNDYLRSGALFLQSRSFKLLGKPNGISHVSLPIETLLMMGSQSFKSIIHALMKNLATYLPLVSELKLHAQDLTNIVYLSVLHPYYQLDHIEMAWGGVKEQA